MDHSESRNLLSKNWVPLVRVRSRKPVALITIVAAVLTSILYASNRLGGRCGKGRSCFQWLDVGQPFGEAWENDQSIQADTKHSDRSGCDLFPNTSSVLLVMKTGASEAYSKIPTQLLTSLRCLDDYLIFSDMTHRIAGRQLHDSLDEVLEVVKERNDEFRLYDQQKLCRADQETCNTGFEVAEDGWALDKYKNIHIAEKSYSQRPSHDWYLFVDADSYVVWPTMMELLGQLNHTEQHYIGSIAMFNGFPFAHGGSGYLMSQGAMQAMFRGKRGVANRYDRAAQSICCGDVLLGKALKNEANISVTNVWPFINGEKPRTLDYAEKQWCQAITTMHHVSSEEVSDLEAFERERGFKSPLRIKDLFHRFVEDELSKKREDWDNLSNSFHYVDTGSRNFESISLRKVKRKRIMSAIEQRAHQSFDACHEACKHNKRCLQFRYSSKGVCSISTTIKHGRPKRPMSENDERITSGWHLERIEAWVRENDDCGDVPLWPEMS